MPTDAGGQFLGPYGAFDNAPFSAMQRPPKQALHTDADATIGLSLGTQYMKPAAALLSKQRALRALFAVDGQRVDLKDVLGNTDSILHCNPRVVSISFTEGHYINKCEYTIVLEADALLQGDLEPDRAFVDVDAQTAGSGTIHPLTRIDQFVADSGTAFIEDFSEEWGLELDDALGEGIDLPRSYRITHSVNATGKTFYSTSGTIDKPAWRQARDFVQLKLMHGPEGSTPPYLQGLGRDGNVSGYYPNMPGIIGSGTLNLCKEYQGYNHVRTENINETQGSYSVTESWLIASGSAYETFSMSTSTSNSDPFVTVQIDGNIKGLSQMSPSGYGISREDTVNSGAYTSALNKYNQISNSGKFGLSSDVYKRANNMVAVQLNSQPTSISLGTNHYNGEITYSLGFNNRPLNIISGVIAETISVNDTYPGDVFAVIPVLGRAQGPVLQYLGGRTEYRRDVSVNLTMDYTKIPYGSGRKTLLMKKPSLVEPTASQIATLLNELSPRNEVGVRKYFISPPSESWNPKEGTYSFNVSFTYELDR
tara:strand:+ start:318 stop:1928 length:1611 start_codon:yes stop_codon:yes gene_type:complete